VTICEYYCCSKLKEYLGGWRKEGIEFIEDVTLCAKWEPVMVKVTDHTSHPPQVTIVNTNGNTVSVMSNNTSNVTIATGH